MSDTGPRLAPVPEKPEVSSDAEESYAPQGTSAVRDSVVTCCAPAGSVTTFFAEQ